MVFGASGRKSGGAAGAGAGDAAAAIGWGTFSLHDDGSNRITIGHIYPDCVDQAVNRQQAAHNTKHISFIGTMQTSEKNKVFLDDVCCLC